jgi:hypothetical protein
MNIREIVCAFLREVGCTVREEVGILYITTPDGTVWDMTVPLPQLNEKLTKENKEKKDGVTTADRDEIVKAALEKSQGHEGIARAVADGFYERIRHKW